MSHELETAVIASLAGRRAAHAGPIGGPCANCATPLHGPWCHACGQLGEDFHRSTLRLCAEAIEGLFHLDGRLWRTLPDLMLRPGRLTRAYLDGHRAPQIPPLRLFLVALLGIFLVGGLVGQVKHPPKTVTVLHDAKGTTVTTTKTLPQLSAAERAKISAQIDRSNITLGGDKADVATSAWLRERLKNTIADPERFYLILEQWSERFAFLMLPLAALLLSLVFITRREFYLFDHVIFSLHSLSAVGLLIIASMALSSLVGGDAYILLLLAPVHLFAHMRGVYRRSVLGTLARMALLFIATLAGALALIVALLAVGLNGMTS